VVRGVGTYMERSGPISPGSGVPVSESEKSSD